MSHTVHPYSHRLGIIRDWKSRWFAMDKSYRTALKTDIIIREFLEKELRSFYVGGIETERTQKTLRVVVKTSRPGHAHRQGRRWRGKAACQDPDSYPQGQDRFGLVFELKLDIEEVRSPESNAAITGHDDSRSSGKASSISPRHEADHRESHG